MRLKVLSVCAAALLLAACSTQQGNEGGAASTDGSAGNGNNGSASTAGGAGSNQIVPGSAEDFITNAGDRVYFGYNSYDLDASAQATLQAQAMFLKNYPSATLVVEGHADERGTREYNLALGERRANSVKQYLAALGVQANRVEVISYGEERPAVVGQTEAAWGQNRRGVSVLQN